MITSYFLTVFLALTGTAPAEGAGDLVVEAQFLKRSELPDSFRFPLLELDYAVLRLVLDNQSDRDRMFQDSEVEVRDPRGRSLDRARPPEITPRIVSSKQFRSSDRQIHGQAGNVGMGVPYPGLGLPPVPVGPTGRGRVRSADTAIQIRTILEDHEMGEVSLTPGEKVEVLLYFKSKQTANQLAGSTVRLGPDIPPVVVP